MDIFSQKCYEELIRDISYKTGLAYELIEPCSDSLHAFIQTIKSVYVTFNYNEEGQLHSKYLEDKYEPAVSVQHNCSITYYYLFDGEIKDCIHPFSVTKFTHTASCEVLYYSSERIEKKMPVRICEYECENLMGVYYYNPSGTTLLQISCGRYVKIDMAGYARRDYILHAYMEPLLFKFAD